MWRVAALVAAAALALAPTAVADPVDNGVIEGRVTNGTTGEPQPGVKVVLKRSRPDGSEAKTWTATTDRRGRFRFAGLATGEDRLYALDARYRGGSFAGGVVRIPTQRPAPVIKTTLKVWRPTSHPGAILILRDSLFVRPFEGGLSVLESLTVVNPTDRAYIGRARAMDADLKGPAPSLGFALPAGAACPPDCGIVDSELDIPEIIGQDYGFAATTAIPPGESRVSFTYLVDGQGGGAFDLTKTALYPTAEISVYATSPLQIESDRLEARGEETIENDRYTVWTAEDLDPGDAVPALAVAEAGFGPGLVAGVALAGFAVLGACVAAFLRNRRRAAPRSAGPRPAPASRSELLAAIAGLDLEYQSGRIPRTAWEERRSGLKEQLTSPSRAR